MFKRLILPFFISLFGIIHTTKAQTSETKTSGYFNTTELSFSKEFLHQYSSKFASIQTVNGYQFNEHFSAGLGIGIDKYLYEGVFEEGFFKGYTLLPVFSDVRIYFGNGKTQPYFGQAVGYAFCLYQPHYNPETGYNNEIGGILINPSFGIKTPLTSKSDLNLSFGYRYQEYTIKNLTSYFPVDPGDPNPTRLLAYKWTTNSQFLTLKVGLTF